MCAFKKPQIMLLIQHVLGSNHKIICSINWLKRLRWLLITNFLLSRIHMTMLTLATITQIAIDAPCIIYTISSLHAFIICMCVVCWCRSLHAACWHAVDHVHGIQVVFAMQPPFNSLLLTALCISKINVFTVVVYGDHVHDDSVYT